jgi:hypothetical protein
MVKAWRFDSHNGPRPAGHAVVTAGAEDAGAGAALTYHAEVVGAAARYTGVHAARKHAVAPTCRHARAATARIGSQRRSLRFARKFDGFLAGRWQCYLIALRALQ